MRVDHKESFSPCACKQLNKMSASLAVEDAVDEGGPQRSFSPCACEQSNNMSASLVVKDAVDEGGPQRECLTLRMQAIEQDVCCTGCGGCCG